MFGIFSLQQLNPTSHFQQRDDAASVTEFTTCLTTSLPALRERLGEMSRSANLRAQVADAVLLNSQESSMKEGTDGMVPHGESSFDKHGNIFYFPVCTRVLTPLGPS